MGSSRKRTDATGTQRWVALCRSATPATPGPDGEAEMITQVYVGESPKIDQCLIEREARSDTSRCPRSHALTGLSQASRCLP